MTGWNVDNFLERLLAQVQQQRDANGDPCPDAETLGAVLEGEAPAPLREQVTEHLKHCQDCAELRNRLLNFDAGGSPEPEAVWKETRKRLDNWLEGFLRSEAARLRAAKPTAPARKGVRWEAFWRPFISWKVVWGVAVVAVLVLIADGLLVMELHRGRSPQAQVAARTAPPQKPVVGAPLVGAQASPAHPPVGAPLVGAQAKQQHAMPQIAERVTLKPQPAPVLNAGAPGSQEAAPSPSSAEVPSLPSQPAQATAQPAPGPATEVATKHPPSLRLEPGAHLLIALSSVTRLSDGSFQFHGILLLPVVHTGPVPLDRGAEVFGAGTTSQDQTSLAVAEFVTEGAHYRLKSGKGEMKAQMPGTGGAVQFGRSQVLEMWPLSPSVYERAPDQPAQPQPQK